MELPFLIAQAQTLKAELDTFRPLDAETEARIFQKLRLDWDYHSNHLEGGKLTYGETKALILFGITAQGKPFQDHLETSGHDEAVKWILEIVKNESPITEKFIRELHELILKQPYLKDAITSDNQRVKRWISIGSYKTAPNHVITQTGETFHFAMPEETPAMMHDLMNWFRQKKENNTISPILLAAEFHYKFIRIHPFDDRNGRMARLLMNFILMQSGFPPAIIRTEDKENYFSALRQADVGIFEPFVAYIAENVIRSLELMLKGAKGESVEDPDDLDKEILLLENKLKGKGEKIEKIKNEETLKEWCENVLPRLTEKFIEVNEKFSRFYVGREYKLSHPHFYWEENGGYLQIAVTTTNFNKNDYLEKIKKASNESISIILLDKIEPRFFQLSCLHHLFNRSNTQNFDYDFKIRITFEQAKYDIIGENSKKTISKRYHQALTDEEINYILQAESKAHLQFIKETTDNNL